MNDCMTWSAVRRTRALADRWEINFTGGADVTQIVDVLYGSLYQFARFFRSSVRISPLPRQIRRSEKFMNTRALQFDKLVEPYYPTLGHFAAGVCGNPLIASVLAPGFFTTPKTAVVHWIDVQTSEI
jgi:hypothetical protein